MKKISMLLMSMLFVMTLGFMSCNGCKNSNDVPVPEVVDTANLVPEHVIAMDREDMFLNYSEDYKWYECSMKLQNYLDEEECDGTIESITNVFQVLDESKSGDIYVVLYTHTVDSTVVDVQPGLWIEDCVLNDDEIKLTYADAYERAMATDAPKPHSKNCILRKPLGPQLCNPQYVFGNMRTQLWVDAITGAVKTSDPSFPDNFNKPLGEWP